MGMTAAAIRAALRANKRAGRRPWSLNQIAKLKGVSRSMMTTALRNPRRYPDSRQFIESLFQGRT
jgi:lambda repressor-like predicted transcriptional regulator